MTDIELHDFALKSANTRVIWKAKSTVRLRLLGCEKMIEEHFEMEEGELLILFGSWWSKDFKLKTDKKCVARLSLGVTTRRLIWSINSVAHSLKLSHIKSCEAKYCSISQAQKHGFAAIRKIEITDVNENRYFIPIKGRSAVTFMLNCLIRLSRKSMGQDVKC